MRNTWRNSRGFTGVELLVVVVVIGLVAGATAGTRVYLQRRAIERSVAANVDAYAQAQMSARAENGRFSTQTELAAADFQFSDDVAISEVQVAADRLFLRIRSVRTGYSCALDFSPVTGAATNRKRCSADVSDPALAAPRGIAIVPGSEDTATVARPPATTRPVDGELLPPDVDDVAEVVLAPGSSRVVSFPILNRSASARTFAFATSSAHPGIVPVPANPAAIHLGSSESAQVPVTVGVASGSLADEASDVELRAADTGDRAYTGAGQVRVRAALVLANPAVVAPAGEIHDAGETFTVQYRVRNSTNAARVLRFSSSIPAGSSLGLAGAVADQEFAALEERPVAVTYHLDPAADGGTQWSAQLIVNDRDAASFSQVSGAFQVTTRLVLVAPKVTGPGSVTQSPGEEFTLAWQVWNGSNAARDLMLTPAGSSGDLVPVAPTGPFVQRLGRGQTATVSIKFRLAAGATCSSIYTATLVGQDAADPALSASAPGTVNTATVLAPPAIVGPAARSDQPGESFTATWQVSNRSNCARSIRIDAASQGDVDVVSVSGGGVLQLQPFEQVGIQVGYRVKDLSLYQTESRPAVRASDQGDAALASAASFVETTALRLCPPTVTGPSGVPGQPQAPGTGATVSFRVGNCSNATRTFALSAESTNGDAVPDPADPTSVTIPAFGALDLSFFYAVQPLAAGGAISDVALRASDTDRPDLTGGRGFRVLVATIINAPSFAGYSDRSILPGQSAPGAAALTSRSNIPVDYCFGVSVGAGDAPAGAVVAPDPVSPACIRVGPYASVQVSSVVSVVGSAEHPRTNQVTVRAFDAARPWIEVGQSFQVTVGLVLASPGLRVPPTPPAINWMVGQERTLDYRVLNSSNASRELCLTVSPPDNVLVAVAPGAICQTVGARQEMVFSHTLRGSSAGEVTVNAVAVDRLAPAYRADGAFEGKVVDAKPVAVWTVPSPVYVRKWAEFDAGRSYSPVGARIAKYIWTWGLFNQQWNGVRFVAGGSGVSTDELATPTTRRAWDLRGTFEVCLVVEDETGRRSDPNCGAVATLLETRARLSFRYRGWWYEPSDWCLDVPWANDCPVSHGNARWEILLNQSQGDVPIKRAWASFRVTFWQTDDEFAQTFQYEGNVQTPAYSYPWKSGPQNYDFFSDVQKATGSVQAAAWRVLDTDGTGASGWPRAPDLSVHPLVLNANLGDATGLIDGGPHWVPDAVWLTLFVEDAYGNITQQAGYLDHKRSEWKGEECINGSGGFFCTRGYERLVPPQAVPVVTMQQVDLGDWRYRFTGTGDSPDGRIVASWWEVTTSPVDVNSGSPTTEVYSGDSIELQAEACEIVTVSLVYVDDRGQRGTAAGEVVRGGRECASIGGPR